MAITIKDIAREAQVSVATVSRVINHNPSVNPEMAQRVKEVIERNQFCPSDSARKAAKRSTKLIGVIVPDISNSIFSRLLKGANSILAQYGYNIIVCDSGGDIEKELHLINVLYAKGVEGIIFSSPIISEEHLKLVNYNKCPVIFVCQEPLFPALKNYIHLTVATDNFHAAREVVHFLYRMGHRQIAFLCGPLFDISAGLKRLQGYKCGLMDLKIPYHDYFVKESKDFSAQSGYDAMKTLYEECPVLPTAVFAACDLYAIGAMEFLYDSGVQVPNQISVIGVDDIEVSAIYRPSLTTLRQNTFEHGSKAAELLLNAIQVPPTCSEVVYVPYSIIRRRSVRSL